MSARKEPSFGLALRPISQCSAVEWSAGARTWRLQLQPADPCRSYRVLGYSKACCLRWKLRRSWLDAFTGYLLLVLRMDRCQMPASHTILVFVFHGRHRKHYEPHAPSGRSEPWASRIVLPIPSHPPYLPGRIIRLTTLLRQLAHRNILCVYIRYIHASACNRPQTNSDVVPRQCVCVCTADHRVCTRAVPNICNRPADNLRVVTLLVMVDMQQVHISCTLPQTMCHILNFL